jgi:KTSC domain
MERVLVESSMITAVGYDATTAELEVVFTSGKVYRYRGVPQHVYDALLAADSKGQFVRANVIDCYPDYLVTRRNRR